MTPVSHRTNPQCFQGTYEGDPVWFILNAHYLIYTPPGAVTYTLAEAQRMAQLTPSTRRIIHEAKKHGARIATARQTARLLL